MAGALPVEHDRIRRAERLPPSTGEGRPAREVHYHDLRHSCASILISLGVDLHTVAKILGHTSINSTQRYAHLQMDPQRAALAKLGGLIAPDRAIKKAADL